MGSLTTNTFKPLDLDTFTEESNAVLELIADYYRDIDKYPVRSQVEPGYLSNRLPATPPLQPHPISAILDDVRDHILPGLTHWQSPNFYAYFPINASNAGFLGEMLCSGLNVNGFCWISSPAATELETMVVDWMATMFALPPAFLFSTGQGGGGVLLGTTCEAVVCTLAAARDRAIDRAGGRIDRLVVYASDQTHFTVHKSSKLIGIPPANFRVIPTAAATGYALPPDGLRSAMEADVQDGLVPLYVCATVGTTGLGAVDPLRELGRVANEFGAWLHVDAAYAGSAAVCPEFQHYFDGAELADSISTNPHKWFLTTLDCCCLWLKSTAALVDSFSANPEYLKNNASDSGGVVDYKDWQITLSRRFKAIKLWVIIRRYGVANLREHIRSDVALAKHFEAMVAMDDRFEVVGRRRFSLVCFRLKPGAAAGHDDGSINEVNRKLLDAINSSGRAFITHTVVGGAFVLRFAIGGVLTEERHIDATWKLIQGKATELLGGR